jgi:coproporphyrinogen III oxidase
MHRPVGQQEIQAVEGWLRSLHDRLTGELETLDGGARFRSDSWDRPEGGGGDSRVIEDGALFEKGGINFSAVQGDALPPSATARRPELAGRSFRATGVSMVLHPAIPTCRRRTATGASSSRRSPARTRCGGSAEAST